MIAGAIGTGVAWVAITIVWLSEERQHKLLVGHLTLSIFKNSGPCNQNSNCCLKDSSDNPRVNKSAGLQSVGTYL